MLGYKVSSFDCLRVGVANVETAVDGHPSIRR